MDPGQVDLTPRERWFLDYFWKSCSFCSAAYFFDSFWCTVVHPMITVQPAVKHAAIALGAGYLRHHCRRSGNENAAKLLEPFIVKQGCKSVSYLLEQQQQIARGGDDCAYNREGVLATCTIMTLLALFCNDASVAGRHVHAGLGIVREWQESGLFHNSGPVGPALHAVGPALHDALSHLLLKTQTYTIPALVLQDDNPLLLHAPVLETFTPMTIRPTLSLFWEYWSWAIARPTTDGFSMGTTVVDDSCSPVLEIADSCSLYKVLIYDRQLSEYVQRVGNSVSPWIRDVSILLQLWRHVVYIIASGAAAAATAAAADEKDDPPVSKVVVSDEI